MRAVTAANSTPAGAPSAVADRAGAVEELATQLAALNPTPDPAASPLLSGSWALVYTGRSATLAPAAFGRGAGGGGPADSLKRGGAAAVQAASDAAYRFFYQAFPLIAGSAVGRRASNSATNIQAIDQASSSLESSPWLLLLLLLPLLVVASLQCARAAPLLTRSCG